jgi:diguanylate cyclase (GGDEF)-like protein
MVFAIRRWIDAQNMLIAASTDILTGILNRRKGWEFLEREIKRSKRYNRPLSIIMFDIDRFKNVNDTYGHQTGDYALRVITKLIQVNLRTTDIFIRWGGEEFLIISVETELHDTQRLAERLRVIIEKYPFEIGSLTVSFGVAQRVENGDIESLLKRVDSKLYEAKSAGRNKVSC